MNINIKSSNIELDENIKAYVERKIHELDKFFQKSEFEPIADVEVGRTTFHHQKGDIYRAEVNIDVPGTLLRVERESQDLYSAIDLVKDDLKREIIKHKKMTETKQRSGMRLLKKIKNLSVFKKYENR